MPHIAIIGAGIGALSAALYLRRQGIDVSIFEKNQEPGGKLARLVHDGSTFDLGPTVLTMPFVLRDLFAAGGADFDERIELMPVEPTCRYHWSDGTRFDAFSDPALRSAELGRVFPGHEADVERLLNDARELYEATKEVFLFNRFRGLREIISPANLRLLPRLASLGFTSTLADSLARRLSSEKLVELFARFATYNGSSPYLAPATLALIAHVELGLGAWYPKGGMARVAEELAALCRANGVELVCSASVRALRGSARRVTEVIVDDRAHRVDGVISNVDALWTFRELLAPLGVALPKRIAGAERSSSGVLVLADVEGEHRELSHHNIFFADGYREEFREIFERKRLPEDMTIYLSISSRSDPTLARPGSENWYILVNAPPDAGPSDDVAANEGYADRIFDRLARFGLTPRVRWRSVMTPRWIETRYNSIGGSIYGSASNSIFSAFLRPPVKVAGMENMYLAGGSAHPGGGVPLVALSGRQAAEAVIADLGGQG